MDKQKAGIVILPRRLNINVMQRGYYCILGNPFLRHPVFFCWKKCDKICQTFFSIKLEVRLSVRKKPLIFALLQDRGNIFSAKFDSKFSHGLLLLSTGPGWGSVRGVECLMPEVHKLEGREFESCPGENGIILFSSTANQFFSRARDLKRNRKIRRKPVNPSQTG
jgi:hypothetical protein